MYTAFDWRMTWPGWNALRPRPFAPRMGAIPCACYGNVASKMLAIEIRIYRSQWLITSRFFNGYSEETFRGFIASHPALLPASLWVSEEACPSRKSEKWLNSLCGERRDDKLTQEWRVNEREKIRCCICADGQTEMYH